MAVGMAGGLWWCWFAVMSLQSLKTEGDSPEADSAAQTEKTFSIGFNDLNGE